MKKLFALILTLCLVFSLAAVNAETFRFEAEYGTVTGSVPGLISVFYGASNKCMLTQYEGYSNGYAVTGLYNEGNDDDIPEITFTIVSDKEAEAHIKLCVGPGWGFDASFNHDYRDTKAGEGYPLMLNGEALASESVVNKADAKEIAVDDENTVLDPASFVVADFGTVTLKAGENVFTLKATVDSCYIDYLEIETDAALTWEETKVLTYRVYDEDEMEYVEVTVE